MEIGKDANPQENPQEPEKIQISADNTARTKPAVIIVERRPDVHYTGFMRPFNPLQILSWIVFFFDFITYFLINMVSLVNHSIALVIICTIVYLVLSYLVLYYAIKATKTDPSDPIIYEQRLTEAQG
jgi:hypothetical protein